MMLLERATDAGEPLVGALVGFRKLVVGNRVWGIVWRETTDENHRPVLDIAEIWAAGARDDGDVYAEMRERVDRLKTTGDPLARPLADVVEKLGRRYSDVVASPEPDVVEPLPSWLESGLRSELRMTDKQISGLSQTEAHQLVIAHWSRTT
jgi:mRNA interferase RelE/StbE